MMRFKTLDDAYVGLTIRIIDMKGEPRYAGKVGKVNHIDSIGQLHGTWGSLAIDPLVDEFEIVEVKDMSITEDVDNEQVVVRSLEDTLNAFHSICEEN